MNDKTRSHYFILLNRKVQSIQMELSYLHKAIRYTKKKGVSRLK